MSDTRELTPHERGLIEPFVRQAKAAQANLQTAINLLAGEEWKGCKFETGTMTFTRPAPAEEQPRPFAPHPPAGPQPGQLSASAES